MSKPKILIILIHKVYLNYYLQEKIIAQLQLSYDLRFVVPKDFIHLVPSNMLQYTETISDEIINKKLATFNLIADVFRWKYRKKSKTFYFREKRLAHPFTLYSIFSIVSKRLGKKKKSKLKSAIKTKLGAQSEESVNAFSLTFFYKYLYWFYKSTLLRFLVRLISHKPLFYLFNFFVVKNFKFSQDMYNFVLENQNDLLIFVTSAHEPLGVFLTQVQKKQNKPILFIIDNWDNLSSKSVLWELPTHVATWGEQSTRHAIKIQGLKSNQVFNLGTARFFNYPVLRSKDLSQLVDYRYILFLGTALPFDEMSCLEVLSNELILNQRLYGELYILYRPHPYGFRNSNAHVSNLPNKVKLDPTVFKNFKLKNEFLDIDKIPSLLKNSELIVGGLTSMLIESTIFAKNFIGLVHKEVNTMTSPQKILINYEHFTDIQILPNLTLCNNLDDLPVILRKTYKKPELSFDYIDDKLDYFYNIKGEDYATKLDRIIKTILNS